MDMSESNNLAGVHPPVALLKKKKSARDKALDPMPENLKAEVLQIAADHGIAGADDPSWLFIRAIMSSREVGLKIEEIAGIMKSVPADVQAAGVSASNEIIATMRKIAAAPVVEVDVSAIEKRLQDKADQAAGAVESSISKGLVAYKNSFKAEHDKNLGAISNELKNAIHQAAIDAITAARPKYTFLPVLIIGSLISASLFAAGLWGAASFIGLPYNVRIDLINLAKNVFSFMIK